MNSTHLKHPPSLRIFFATEMWERYGFYVVQTLLALYLALRFHWQDKQIYELVGSFTALTYVSPLIGGWIADHLLGQKRTILSGAFVLLVSYFALSFTSSNHGLTLCLASIAIGSGLLKPNISSLLGNEYPEGSPNREKGFTLFYLGITTGIIMGSTFPGYLHHHFGWSVAFFFKRLHWHDHSNCRVYVWTLSLPYCGLPSLHAPHEKRVIRKPHPSSAMDCGILYFELTKACRHGLWWRGFYVHSLPHRLHHIRTQKTSAPNHGHRLAVRDFGIILGILFSNVFIIYPFSTARGATRIVRYYIPTPFLRRRGKRGNAAVWCRDCS